MKTRNVILSALVALVVSVSAFAGEPVNSRLVVLNQKYGLFRVIYEGAKAGKVSMQITDEAGNKLFAETMNSISGFTRPVNFDGLAHGVYTIEITDASGILVEKVNYQSETVAKNVSISRTPVKGKYLLTTGDQGVREIKDRKSVV